MNKNLREEGGSVVSPMVKWFELIEIKVLLLSHISYCKAYERR